MGQKTHPKGFRLTTTQKHLSDGSFLQIYNLCIKQGAIHSSKFSVAYRAIKEVN